MCIDLDSKRKDDLLSLIDLRQLEDVTIKRIKGDVKLYYTWKK